MAGAAAPNLAAFATAFVMTSAGTSVSGHGLLDRCEEVYVYEKMRDAALDLSHHMGYTEVKLPAGRTHL